MDEDQKKLLRKRIEEEIATCRIAIKRLEKSASPVAPDKALGRLTRMDSLNDQGISHAALQQHREKLYKLGLALEQVNRPGFGDCVLCGRPIPTERLMALPESTKCVSCASR